MVSSIVALIEDQINKSLILFLSHFVSDDILISYNIKKMISVIVLTPRNTAIDKNIWKKIGEGVYLVVWVLLKIFLQPTSMF